MIKIEKVKFNDCQITLEQWDDEKGTLHKVWVGSWYYGEHATREDALATAIGEICDDYSWLTEP